MDKRTFLKITGAAGAGLVLTPWMGCAPGEPEGQPSAHHHLRPRNVHASSPWVCDGRIGTRHRCGHHGDSPREASCGLRPELNAALDGVSVGLDGSLESLLAWVAPDNTALRNNGGGHYNHTLYWEVLRPGGPAAPEGDLAELIARDLGGVESFAAAFAKAGATQFGSGWAWLIVNGEGKLEVTSTANQDNPLMTQCVERTGTPILGMDVWEHAYYLNYQNRRKDYIQAFLSLVNWEAVSARLDGAVGAVR